MRGEERGRGRGLPRRRKQVPVCMEESLPERPRGRGMAGGGSVPHGPSVFTDLEVRLRGGQVGRLSRGNRGLRSGHRAATCVASAHRRVGLESSLES